jgi:DNA repair protein RecO (recombination protein O)
MLNRTEGLVLSTFPFGEADLIATYLTLDFGLIKLFVKSPRKIKSRFGSSLEPLTQARISFWGKEDANLPRLTQSDIIHPFHIIRDHLRSFLKVSEIIELTMKFIPERDINKKVYALFLTTLQAIEHHCSDLTLKHGAGEDGKKVKGRFSCEDLILNQYKIRFLTHAGFAPKLDVCGRCGQKGFSFYISQGSILCDTCAKGIDSPIRLSPAVMHFYADLLAWDTAKINRLKPSGMLFSEVSDIINMHIKYILTKPLKSGVFVQSLSG